MKKNQGALALVLKTWPSRGGTLATRPSLPAFSNGACASDSFFCGIFARHSMRIGVLLLLLSPLGEAARVNPAVATAAAAMVGVAPTTDGMAASSLGDGAVPKMELALSAAQHAPPAVCGTQPARR